PKECAVFEDILPAVKVALSAGMKVFAVEEHTVSEEEKSQIKEIVHEYIDSFNDLLVN
ncbi:HAD family phosphatase, partial [Clostridium perfringens]